MKTYLVDYANKICAGCNQSSDDIAEYGGYTDEDFEESSILVNDLWYCCSEDCRKANK